jgi:hypothetical protein
MKLVDFPTLPDGAVLSNCLYWDPQPEDLTQDLVTVRLSNGFYVDLGWYPEHDSAGEFVIRVFEGFGDQHSIDPLRTKSIHEAIETVQRLANRFSQGQVALGRASSSPAPKQVHLREFA